MKIFLTSVEFQVTGDFRLSDSYPKISGSKISKKIKVIAQKVGSNIHFLRTSGLR